MKRALASITGIIALALGVTACSDGGSGDKPADKGTIKVVASTSIWGSIAEEIAKDSGEKIEVKTILSGKNDDPHEYEATARDLAELKSADIVVGNGAGYDNWLTDHVEKGTPVVTAKPVMDTHHDHGSDHGDAHDHGSSATSAASESAHADHADHADHAGHADAATTSGDEHDVNPHVWFDIDTVTAFEKNLSAELHKLNSAIPEKDDKVTQKTEDLKKRIANLPERNVILTESVPEYVVKASKLKDITPTPFADSVNRESEPSAADLAATRELITNGQANILITNEQAETPAASQLIDAAKSKGTKIVNINETPDEGQSYFDYASGFIERLEDAAK